jgi:hypothetical protein
MERTKWTDDLIDERMGSIDDKLARLLQETQTLRSELHREIGAVRTDLGREIGAVRADFGREVGGLRAELVTFRNQVMWLLGGLVVSLVGLLGAAVIQL